MLNPFLTTNDTKRHENFVPLVVKQNLRIE